MRVEKTAIAQLPMVYAVSSLELDGRLHLLAATEAEGECLLFSPPDWRNSVVWEGPGGTMNVVPVPGRRAVLAIQRFFPIFQSEEAQIVWAEPEAEVCRPWRVTPVWDLPFVHRLDTIQAGGQVYLVAATLCGGKQYRDDWSQPGRVVVARLPQRPSDRWEPQCVLEGVHKNHGLHVTQLEGRPTVLISGAEGLFALYAPTSDREAWRSERLLDHEISDICACDLDGDGEPEIAAIEPFHGNALVVYKRTGGGWRPLAQWEADFGHALWAGELCGRPSVLIGNRGGEQDLTLIAVESGDPFRATAHVLDTGVGPAQATVVRHAGEDLLLSANHGRGEVALYRTAI